MFQLKKSCLNLFITHFNRLKGQLCIFAGKPSLRETTPLVTVTWTEGSLNLFQCIKIIITRSQRKNRVVLILILQKINPQTLDG